MAVLHCNKESTAVSSKLQMADRSMTRSTDVELTALPTPEFTTFASEDEKLGEIADVVGQTAFFTEMLE